MCLYSCLLSWHAMLVAVNRICAYTCTHHQVQIEDVSIVQGRRSAASSVHLLRAAASQEETHHSRCIRDCDGAFPKLCRDGGRDVGVSIHGRGGQRRPAQSFHANLREARDDDFHRFHHGRRRASTRSNPVHLVVGICGSEVVLQWSPVRVVCARIKRVRAYTSVCKH